MAYLRRISESGRCIGVECVLIVMIESSDKVDLSGSLPQIKGNLQT